MSGRDGIREALGAYTVGALDPAERTAVEGHLAGCPACREELAELAALPGLLSRLSADEAAAGTGPVPDHVLEAAVARAAHERRAARRRLRGWRAAAAAALVVLLAVVTPFGTAAPATTYSTAATGDDAAPLAASAAVWPRPWGMSVEFEARNLPDSDGYGLWAVDGDDHRAVAASWTATDDGSVRLTGSCYMALDDVVRFEVTNPDGDVLATLTESG
jgi:anti-sigma-K factor RskA